jgi:hypothetical protein
LVSGSKKYIFGKNQICPQAHIWKPRLGTQKFCISNFVHALWDWPNHIGEAKFKKTSWYQDPKNIFLEKIKYALKHISGSLGQELKNFVCRILFMLYEIGPTISVRLNLKRPLGIRIQEIYFWKKSNMPSSSYLEAKVRNSKILYFEFRSCFMRLAQPFRWG